MLLIGNLTHKIKKKKLQKKQKNSDSRTCLKKKKKNLKFFHLKSENSIKKIKIK